MSSDGGGNSLGTTYVEIVARVDQMENDLNNLKSRTGQRAEEIGSLFSGKIGEHINKLSAMFTGLFAVGKIFGFMKEGVQMFEKSDDAIHKLTFAVGAASGELEKYAEAQAKVTRFKKTELTDGMAFAGMYTKDAEQIKKLTQAAMDLAAAKGWSFEQANQVIVRTFGSEVKMMRGVQLAVEGAAGSEERLKSITEGLSNHFGGVAAAMADTYAGRMNQVEKNVAGLQKRLGAELLPAIDTVAESLGAMANDTKGATDLMNGLGVAAKIVAGVFLVIKTIVVAAGQTIGMFGAMVVALTQFDFKHVADIWERGNAKITDTMGDYLEGMKKLMQQEKEIEMDVKVKPIDYKPGSDKEKDAAKEEAKTKADVTREMYDALKFEANDYYKYKLDLINTEVEAMKKAGLDAVNIEKFKNESIRNLDSEYATDTASRFKPNLNYEKTDNSVNWEKETKKFFDKMKSVPEKDFGDWKPFNTDEWDAELKQQFAYMGDAARTASNIVMSDFTSVWDKVFGHANSLFQKFIQSMAAQLLSLATEKLALSIFGFVLSPFTGGASAGAAAAMGGFHNGGTFENFGHGSFAMSPRFASGVNDFLVPQGFPNDSFPIRVESGERVTVTPAGQNSNGNEAVINSIQALNMNLIKKNMNPVVNIHANIDGLTFTKNTVNKSQLRLQEAGVRNVI